MASELINKNHLNFQMFGVKIGIRAEKQLHLDKVRQQLEKVFPNGIEKINIKEVEHHFFIKPLKNKIAEFYYNEEKLFESFTDENFYEAIESRIRITIAEFAVGKVFIHAGVVAWKGRAIIIPAQSWSGKSTLVAELIKKGALYYSDEYAVLDSEGNVAPFPKWISLREKNGSSRQIDYPIESFGGKAGTKTIPVGMVLIARYSQAKQISQKWKPKRLSVGKGIMEILLHTVAIRNEPKFVLEVLKKLSTRAIIVKTVRGEAKEFAESLLNYFDVQTD